MVSKKGPEDGDKWLATHSTLLFARGCGKWKAVHPRANTCARNVFEKTVVEAVDQSRDTVVNCLK